MGSFWGGFFWLAVAGTVALLLTRRRETDETKLSLKLFGCVFLGSLRFNANNGPYLPLGFALAVFFFHPTVNRKIKWLAVYLGLLSYILSVTVTAGVALYETRTREVVADMENVYAADLAREFERIADSLKLPWRTDIQDFRMEFAADGTVENVNCTLLVDDNGEQVLYQIGYVPDKANTYRVERRKAGDGYHVGRLVKADWFFREFSALSLKVLIPPGNYLSYTFRFEGQRFPYHMPLAKNYHIVGGKPVAIDSALLPVEGHALIVYGSENGVQITEPYFYFLEPTFQGNGGAPR